MSAYYSEFDTKAAAWLRELIKRGLIADGVVDERDLWDVPASDLRGFTQVHLCAGIGVWSYALRRAGWADDRPVWTGSFPCQPFSAAGKGAGFADERHLWPAGYHLIEQCRPPVVFGEQVASKDAEPWLDLVQADMEAVGYAFGAVAFPSAGVGAPHIRDRTYWVADAAGKGAGRRRLYGPQESHSSDEQRPSNQPIRDGVDGGLADASSQGLPLGSVADDGRRALRVEGPSAAQGELSGGLGHSERLGTGRDAGASAGPEGRAELWPVGDDAGSSGAIRGLAYTAGPRHAEAGQHERGSSQLPARSAEHGRVDRVPARSGRGLSDGAGAEREHGLREVAAHAGPVNGSWGNADWIYCRNGEWRPVEPGTFPLADGAPARVGRLRGYGNAINAEAAVAWIETYLEAEADRRGFRLTEPSVLPHDNLGVFG